MLYLAPCRFPRARIVLATQLGISVPDPTSERLFYSSHSRYFTEERVKKEHKGVGDSKIFERMLQVASTTDLIRLGSRGRPPPIDGVGVDWVNGKSGFQQSGDQQAMSGFDDAGHFGFPLRATDGLQKVGQFGQSFDTVCHLALADLLPGLIKDHDVVLVVSPVDASVPHGQIPSRAPNVPGAASPSTVALEARLSHDRFSRNSDRRRTIFLKRSSRMEGTSLSPVGSDSSHEQAYPCSGPSVRGLETSLM
jgi:hypothetical protein